MIGNFKKRIKMKNITHFFSIVIFVMFIKLYSSELLKGVEYFDSDADGVVDKAVFIIDSSISYTEISEYYFKLRYYVEENYNVMGEELQYMGSQKYSCYMNQNDIIDHTPVQYLSTDFQSNNIECKMYLDSNDSLVSKGLVIDKVSPVICAAMLFPSSTIDTLSVIFSEPVDLVDSSNFFIIYSKLGIKLEPKFSTFSYSSNTRAIFLFDSSYAIDLGDSINLNYHSNISDAYGNIQNHPNNKHVPIHIKEVAISNPLIKAEKKDYTKRSMSLYNIQGREIRNGSNTPNNVKLSNGLYFLKSKNLNTKKKMELH